VCLVNLLSTRLSEDRLEFLPCAAPAQLHLDVGRAQGMTLTQNLRHHRKKHSIGAFDGISTTISDLAKTQAEDIIQRPSRCRYKLTVPEMEKPVKTKLMSCSLVQMSLTPSTWRSTRVGSKQ